MEIDAYLLFGSHFSKKYNKLIDIKNISDTLLNKYDIKITKLLVPKKINKDGKLKIKTEHFIEINIDNREKSILKTSNIFEDKNYILKESIKRKIDNYLKFVKVIGSSESPSFLSIPIIRKL